MKIKEYFKELSLAILGVLIALFIDSYRESARDRSIVNSYLKIVAEDLSFDIQNFQDQLKRDSAYAKKLKFLGDVLTQNPDLPFQKFSLSSWTQHDTVRLIKLDKWDSLDYYTQILYANNEYTTRKIGFTTITNSNLGHQIDESLLKQITIYYTTDSNHLDFVTEIDDRCHWLGIEYLNQYQGSFKKLILNKDFNSTQLRNEASGRYNTTLTEMEVKREMLLKAKELLTKIRNY